jgi:hypothetical protein
MLTTLRYPGQKHSGKEAPNICVIYACIGSDALKVAGILRSAQNDSTDQDAIDQYKTSDLCA